MTLPTKEDAERLLAEHVGDEHQRLHAKMVATAIEGYAPQFGGDPLLWYVTALTPADISALKTQCGIK